MRILIAIPAVLALGACNVSKEGNAVTVQYDQNTAENTAADVGNTAQNIASRHWQRRREHQRQDPEQGRRRERQQRAGQRDGEQVVGTPPARQSRNRSPSSPGARSGRSFAGRRRPDRPRSSGSCCCSRRYRSRKSTLLRKLAEIAVDALLKRAVLVAHDQTHLLRRLVELERVAVVEMLVCPPVSAVIPLVSYSLTRRERSGSTWQIARLVVGSRDLLALHDPGRGIERADRDGHPIFRSWRDNRCSPDAPKPLTSIV